MSSRSNSESEQSNRSRSSSPVDHGTAPTPGHGLNRSASNSPEYNKNNSSPQGNQSFRSGSRSPASSAGSNRSRKSRSKSVASNRSRASDRSGSRSRSRSRSKSRSRSRSRSSSNRSRSGSRSNRSRSGSVRSNKSAGSNHSRSRSRSGSPNLQIDDDGNESEKRHESSGDEKGSNVGGTKKKNRVIDSDSDGNEEKSDNAQKDAVSAAAIFGDDADDISSEDEDDANKEAARKSDSEEDQHQEKHLSDEEHHDNVNQEEENKENEPEPIPETRIDVEIPKISCDLGRDIHFVKLPNFLSVETRPFDPETYEDEIDEEETLDEEGRARLKLKVENTIRWRDVVDEKDGNVKKESNARLVKWSDGSFSLHLGSEIFDVYKQPLQGDHNHLFIRQGTGLQGQAVFRTKLSFRPHSTESFTHRKMTLSLADRSQKTSGIKILSQVGADPDHDRKFLLKKEEEKLRQTVRVSKPRRKGDLGGRSHSYREEDGSDEEGAISLNAIKNKYKSGAAIAAKAGGIYSSDEDGSDFEARRAKKMDKAKALKDSESSEESE